MKRKTDSNNVLNRFAQKLQKLAMMSDGILKEAVREEAKRILKEDMDFNADEKGNLILKKGPVTITVDGSFIDDLQSHGFGGKKTNAVPQAGDVDYSKELAAALAEKIRAAREAQNLSRNEAAKIIGCSPASLFLWESGRNVPTKKFYDRLQDFVSKKVE